MKHGHRWVTRVVVALALFGAGCSDDDAGRESINLTHSVADDRYPNWSPDGTAIVFESMGTGSWDVFRMMSDGSGVEQLTDSDQDERFPTWSPDGMQIAFVREDSVASRLVVYNLADRSEVVFAPHPGGMIRFPDWSPDAGSIAYTLNVDGARRIGVFDLATGTADLLTDGPHRSVWPRWSPDGTEISFFSRRDTQGEHDDIYTMTSDGGSVRRITSKAGHDFCPTWSPDGDKIAGASISENGSRVISVFDLNGRVLSVVGLGKVNVSEPSWSPDGTKMLFIARSADHYDIFVQDVPRE